MPDSFINFEKNKHNTVVLFAFKKKDGNKDIEKWKEGYKQVILNRRKKKKRKKTTAVHQESVLNTQQHLPVRPTKQPSENSWFFNRPNMQKGSHLLLQLLGAS